jgi:sigma-B regulation protein RsbU (phosphoserine phosphatase)
VSRTGRLPATADWRQLAGLGEQLFSATSLFAQRDRIIAVTEHLLGGRAQLWLQEELFHLPDRDEQPLFSLEPPLSGMRQALKNRKLFMGVDDSTHGVYVAVPLEEQGLVMGVLQVSRPDGPEFHQGELELLEGLASIVAVSLVASHRVAVERFRLEQLNLVRRVSAQIANILDVDELSRRVVCLIQETFNYYSVAIFTLALEGQGLRHRSSAITGGRKQRKPSFPSKVEFGQGLVGHAAQSGKEIVCDDVRVDSRYRPIASLPETRTEVALPLKVEDRLLGVLDVRSNQPRAFHPNDLLVLRALADNVALALEGARLYGDLRRRADQLTVIAEVSSRVNANLDLSTLMHEVSDLIRSHFGYPYVHLFSVHINRRRIIYEAGSGRRSRSLDGYSLSLDEPKGIIPWVARSGQTALLNDVSKDPRYHPSPLPPKNTRAELTVPLIFDDDVVGVLDIQSDRIGSFSQDDQLIFEALADSVAVAIHNVDLYSSEQWRRQVADSLREVAVLLSTNVGVEQVLETILTELERNLPTDVTAVWLLDEGDLYLAAAHGCSPAKLEKARRDSAEASVQLDSVLLAESPQIRKPSEPIGPSGLAAGFAEDYSSIAAPLRVGEQPVGVLTLSHHTPGRYGHEAQAMTTTFASYAAVAIENARLYNAAQEQAYASAALLQAAQAVVSLGDLDEILSTIIRIMPILVGVDRAAIYLWDGLVGVFRPAQAYGLTEQAKAVLWKEQVSPREFPFLEAARQTNCLLLHVLKPNQAPSSWRHLKVPQEQEGGSALQTNGQLLLAVPLSIKSDVFGVLLVQEGEGGRRFRERRLEIITGMAQQAALAIQNDRLQEAKVVRERLEHEMQLARQIQQTFIPEHLPEHPGWELAARWRTALQVGGDFYDVIDLPGQRLGLFIADVADKGIPAALFMALTRTLVRAAVVQTESPAEALQRVNDLLLPDTKQGMFVTAAYAVLHLDTGEMTYANAGHNPPLLLKNSVGKVKRLTRTGMALGVAEGIRIDQRTIHLAPGEIVLFYTDGLTEAFSPNGDMFGEKRLLKYLAALKVESVEQILEAVDGQLSAFMGNLPLADDLTMLVARRLLS